MRALGAQTTVVQCRLGNDRGCRRCHSSGSQSTGRSLANAGHGLGHAFLDQDFDESRHVIDTNITGTLDLVHQVVGRMRARGHGRMLMTGSIAGVIRARSRRSTTAPRPSSTRSLGAAQRAQGHRHHRDVPHAGGHGDAILRARRAHRHEGRTVGEGRSGRRARRRFRAMQNGERQVVAG